MKDMAKASNPFYLAFFLLLVCGISTLVMAYVAAKTQEPIEEAKKLDTDNSLKRILPEFDKTEKSGIKTPDGKEVILYTATKNGRLVGYAVESSGKGFGGDVNGIVSFKPDGTIDKVIVKNDHSETPGIGTKVTDRTVKRTILDVLGIEKEKTQADGDAGKQPGEDTETQPGEDAGKQPGEELPPNAALDSYSGVKPGDEKWTKEKDASHFVSGATYSSNAVCDLVWDAATAIRDYIAAQGQQAATDDANADAQPGSGGSAPADKDGGAPAAGPEAGSDAESRPAAVPAAQQSQEEN